jgi:hypothetical protein
MPVTNVIAPSFEMNKSDFDLKSAILYSKTWNTWQYNSLGENWVVANAYDRFLAQAHGTDIGECSCGTPRPSHPEVT